MVLFLYPKMLSANTIELLELRLVLRLEFFPKPKKTSYSHLFLFLDLGGEGSSIPSRPGDVV